LGRAKRFRSRVFFTLIAITISSYLFFGKITVSYTR
jgi:hypothetical protein